MSRFDIVVRIIATLASVGCLVLTYLWIDRSVTLSYVSQSASDAERMNRQLESMVDAAWAGMPEADLRQRLEAIASRSGLRLTPIVKTEGGAVWFDDIRFNLQDGRVSSVGASADSISAPR